VGGVVEADFVVEVVTRRGLDHGSEIRSGGQRLCAINVYDGGQAQVVPLGKAGNACGLKVGCAGGDMRLLGRLQGDKERNENTKVINLSQISSNDSHSQY